MSAHVTSVLSLPCHCWTSLKKDFILTFLFYVFGGLPRCLSMLHMYTVLTEVRTGVRCPWNWSHGQLIATYGCWEWNPGHSNSLQTLQLSHHLSLSSLSFVSGWILQDFLRRPHVVSSSSPCSSVSSTSLSVLGTRQWSSGGWKHVLHGWASNLWDGKPGLAFEAATKVVFASTNWSSGGPLDF